MIHIIQIVFQLLILSATLVTLIFIGTFMWLRWSCLKCKDRNKSGKLNVAFFHPYCNAGGGGERVLWCAVRAVQERYPTVQISVYTGDLDASPADIIKRANNIFNVKINNNVKFIYLHRRNWVEARCYPYFTLLGQSLGSMWLALEALDQLQPDILIDTMGYAFSSALFKYVYIS